MYPLLMDYDEARGHPHVLRGKLGRVLGFAIFDAQTASNCVFARWASQKRDTHDLLHNKYAAPRCYSPSLSDSASDQKEKGSDNDMTLGDDEASTQEASYDAGANDIDMSFEDDMYSYMMKSPSRIALIAITTI